MATLATPELSGRTLRGGAGYRLGQGWGRAFPIGTVCNDAGELQWTAFQSELQLRYVPHLQPPTAARCGIHKLTPATAPPHKHPISTACQCPQTCAPDAEQVYSAANNICHLWQSRGMAAIPSWYIYDIYHVLVFRWMHRCTSVIADVHGSAATSGCGLNVALLSVARMSLPSRRWYRNSAAEKVPAGRYTLQGRELAQSVTVWK